MGSPSPPGVDNRLWWEAQIEAENVAWLVALLITFDTLPSAATDNAIASQQLVFGGGYKSSRRQGASPQATGVR